MTIDPLITYSTSGTLLVLVALIVSFQKNRADRLANLFLAVYFWSYALTIIISALVIYGYVVFVPHLYRTAFIPGSLIIPFSFLYLSKKLNRTKPTAWWLFHLLPLIVYLIDYQPFFVLSAEEKLSLYFRDADNMARLKMAYDDGWFMPAYGHAVFRHVFYFGYWVAQIGMLVRAKKNPDHRTWCLSSDQWRWFQMLVGSQVFIFLPVAIAVFGGNEEAASHWINAGAILASLIQVYFLFTRPTVLYKLNEWPDQVAKPTLEVEGVEDITPHPAIEVFAAPQASKTGAIQTLKLSDAALLMIEDRVLEVINAKKPFTRVRYSISDLSVDTGIPGYRLSAFINQRYDVNFYGFLNQFRVRHFLNKVEAGEHKTKTIEAIARECGFQSRSTFIRVFKSFKGTTPSEYLALQSGS